jgi:RNA 3'-terminal phosphate cyclase (ATP)
MDALEIDGSQGEGGGQILRTSLSLAMLTGKTIHLKKIRAGRAKPGLMRQHLVCVSAAQAMCSAFVEGAELGAQALTFVPNSLLPGQYHFDIGSAGSTMLVLQTVLPAMLQMSSACAISLIGGTHNPLAPSAHFFRDSFLPQLHAMGANVQFDLDAVGLFPAGGGKVRLATDPDDMHLQQLILLERQGAPSFSAEAIVADVPEHVAQRELICVREHGRAEVPTLAMGALRARSVSDTGPGNVLDLSLRYDNVCAHFTAFGSRRQSAEDVARAAYAQMRQFLHSDAVVEEHLADQLLLPMALARGGEFLTGEPSEHLRTNAQVIEQFGVAKIVIERFPAPEGSTKNRATPIWRVCVQCR